MNYINSIIRILEIPPLRSYNNVLTIRFKARIPCLRNKIEQDSIINCTVWGELAYDLVNYYQINDYVLIEGYISILNNKDKSKAIIPYNLNITKLYPFLFTFEASS